MLITIIADDDHAITVVNPKEIRIETDCITFEASVEDGHQIYTYRTETEETK